MGGLQALRALGHLELHVLVLLEAAERRPGRFSTRLPRSLERRARTIVLCERAGDTNRQDSYDQLPQPIRCPVHSHPPAVASDLPGRERTPS